MKRYVIRRLLMAIPLLLAISFVCFVFINMIPSNPAEVVLRIQQTPIITEEAIAEMEEALGLNKPFLVLSLIHIWTDKALAPGRFDIELKDVSFSYGGGRKVIDHVSLKIPQGTTCAVVGPSGSGKTTLCSLIARFWDVQEGSVCVGGTDVKAVSYTHLDVYKRQIFGLAFGRPQPPCFSL